MYSWTFITFQDYFVMLDKVFCIRSLPIPFAASPFSRWLGCTKIKSKIRINIILLLSFIRNVSAVNASGNSINCSMESKCWYQQAEKFFFATYNSSYGILLNTKTF